MQTMGSDGFAIRSFDGGITAVDAHSDKSFLRHSHDEFGIGLITLGAQRSWSGRGPVEAVRGNLITVNPAETHDGAPIGAARAWSMLYFRPSTVGAAVSDISEGRHATRELHAPVVADPRVARLFVSTRATVLCEQAGEALDERLLMLFGALLGTNPQPAAVPCRLMRVRDRIDAAPSRAHSLAELAAIAGLNRFQTLRGFVRLTGSTPHAYLIHRRLDRARHLIRTGVPIAHAAADAGFADQSHLHRAFVARYGYTPGAYAAATRGCDAISFKSTENLLRYPGPGTAEADAMESRDRGGGDLIIRPCSPDDFDTILAIINAAAGAYRGVIPDDCWHDPYMKAATLKSEIVDGVVFSAAVRGERLVGVMGLQRRGDVDLIRHAYVRPEAQRQQVGSKLMDHVSRGGERPILVGTWRSASWAIGFYERRGFRRVADADIAPLLSTYWRVPDRQIAISVVLASPALSTGVPIP